MLDRGSEVEPRNLTLRVGANPHFGGGAGPTWIPFCERSSRDQVGNVDHCRREVVVERFTGEEPPVPAASQRVEGAALHQFERLDEMEKALCAAGLGPSPKAQEQVRIQEHTLVQFVRGHAKRGARRGRSTAAARTSLSQMLDLAVKHGAIPSNPMRLVEPTSRAPKHAGGVEHLTVAGALALRRRVRPEELRISGARRGPNEDLRDWVDVLLGTGARDGEVLGLRWADVKLDTELPTAHIGGTLVEPRRGYVEKLHRQDRTKSGNARLLVLPAHVAQVLRSRRRRSDFTTPTDPVFATRTGEWISPANMRTRLRKAAAGVDLIDGCTPHTLRRTVGTLVAHEAGLDAAREQLGHSDPSVTYQHYVGRRVMAPDLRSVLDAFFAPLDPTEPVIP